MTEANELRISGVDSLSVEQQQELMVTIQRLGLTVVGSELAEAPEVKETKEQIEPVLVNFGELRSYAISQNMSTKVPTRSWSVITEAFKTWKRSQYDIDHGTELGVYTRKLHAAWRYAGLDMKYVEEQLPKKYSFPFCPEGYFVVGLESKVRILGVTLNSLYEGLKAKKLFGLYNFGAKIEQVYVNYVNATLQPDVPLEPTSPQDIQAQKQLADITAGRIVAANQV